MMEEVKKHPYFYFIIGIVAVLALAYFKGDHTHVWEIWRWPWDVRWSRMFTLVR
jgi:hypothetical protein